MSIAVLHQVYEETRRLAIAGSQLAQGDFRLKKLLPPLEAAAAKAPVFGKVAEAAKTLLEAKKDQSATALLELCSLISAILYTQGETGAEGELKPIETTNVKFSTTKISARLLKPLLESLTQTGSGREEFIKDAHARGLFQDLRLINVALKAIDDSYSPIAEFITNDVLPMYGTAIYDELRNTFDVKGKAGHIRRLRLMHQLDKVKTQPLVEQALEAGNVEMKVAAVRCLEGRADMLSYLFEQARAKSKEVRKAALEAMAPIDDDSVAETLIKALSGKELENAHVAGVYCMHPKVANYLHEEMRSCISQLTQADFSKAFKQAPAKATAKTPAKKKLPAAADGLEEFASRMQFVLLGLSERKDATSFDLVVSTFEKRDALAKLPSEYQTSILNTVCVILIDSGVEALRKQVADAHATLPPEQLALAFLAALEIYKPKKVHEIFSVYLTAPAKKKNDLAQQRKEAIRGMLRQSPMHYKPSFWCFIPRGYQLKQELTAEGQLDPAWLDSAIAADDVECVRLLAVPKHKAAQAYLGDKISTLLDTKNANEYEATNLLRSLVQLEHPLAVEYFLEALTKFAKAIGGSYRSYYLAQLIVELPKSAIPKIESLLPSFQEQVADRVANYLAELQAKED